ncbi:MAG: class I SAM-dependent methyltransferase [Candidatus Eisenbacteria bacterium]|nr:class I SAM-dependent methyltransferase [Candidatus Eisenbacteria bacterium]
MVRVHPKAEPSPLACTRRADCRACGDRSLEPVLSFGRTPLANSFVRADQMGEPQETFPLDLFLCPECGLLQLLDVVDPGVLFRDYLYVSSTSPSFIAHFEKYAESVVGESGIRPGSLVVEIGSNDGILLRPFQARGMRVLGVDPAREIARAACEAGIPTLSEFFTGELAARIRAEHGPASVIAANNVLAHVDDLHGVLDAVAGLLAPDGILVFEVSYLLDVIEKTLFDMTYHEHLCYHAVGPLETLLARHGMQLIEARRVPTHGGSLRAVAQRATGGRPRGGSVDELLALEARAGLRSRRTFEEFGGRIRSLGDELRGLLTGLKTRGEVVAGFGAPAKLTTLMHHFEIGRDLVEFIVDDSPLKQLRYTPGYHIPVLPVSEMYERRPDAVLILAWNFAADITRKHAAYLEHGGRFIVPLPKLEVISHHA